MNSNVVSMISARLAAQPHDVRTLADKERDALIVSAIQVDGVWVIKSRYGDDTWALAGGTSNVAASKRVLDFGRLPRLTVPR